MHQIHQVHLLCHQDYYANIPNHFLNAEFHCIRFWLGYLMLYLSCVKVNLCLFILNNLYIYYRYNKNLCILLKIV